MDRFGQRREMLGDVGDDHVVLAGRPGLLEGFDADLFTLGRGSAAVAKIDSVGIGNDRDDDHQVVGLGPIVVIAPSSRR